MRAKLIGRLDRARLHEAVDLLADWLSEHKITHYSRGNIYLTLLMDHPSGEMEVEIVDDGERMDVQIVLDREQETKVDGSLTRRRRGLRARKDGA